jgi:hypothetical protein
MNLFDLNTLKLNSDKFNMKHELYLNHLEKNIKLKKIFQNVFKNNVNSKDCKINVSGYPDEEHIKRNLLSIS